MQSSNEDGRSSKRRRLEEPQGGPYVLRQVLGDIPVADQGGDQSAVITCVEYWNSNLYIGTSNGEVLHYFVLPPDPTEDGASPTFIPASRLPPSGHDRPPPLSQPGGVRQIVVLPTALKACVLCNGVVSFYSLPELSPIFQNKEPTGVQWIGGIDDSEEIDPDGPVVMIANSKRILRVRIGERLRPVRNNIEYPGCLRTSRRGTIACVADASTYALLDVEHQAKIPLFPIATAGNEDNAAEPTTTADDIQDLKHPERSSPLSGRDLSPSAGASHSRSTSLGNKLDVVSGRQQSPISHGRSSSELKPSSQSGISSSPVRSSSLAVPSSIAEARATSPAPSLPKFRPQPHILSPSSTEFMLTTGSGEDEPGVIMTVNLDGDVVRGTIELSRYPQAVVVDKPSPALGSSQMSSDDTQNDCLLSLISRNVGEEVQQGIEIRSLSTDSSTMAHTKGWIALQHGGEHVWPRAGLHRTLEAFEHTFSQVGEALRLVRLRNPGRSPPPGNVPEELDPRTKVSVQRLEGEQALFEAGPSDSAAGVTAPDWEVRRAAEEARFAQSMGFAQTLTTAWSGNIIYQILRNPLLLQLEAMLSQSVTVKDDTEVNTAISDVLQRIKGREAQTEAEYLSLKYIKQKASLILFLDLKPRLESKTATHAQVRNAENALLEGELDPRVILLTIPFLQDDVQQGPEGIWIHHGLADLVRTHVQLPVGHDTDADLLAMVRSYLSTWQTKRGYGSIPDEKLVFDSVDAALLHVLLQLEVSVPSENRATSPTRTKLNNTVDNWKGDFNSAVALLEKYNRLYVLSRFYGTKKMSKDVLRTWKRIIDGEIDPSNELSPDNAELKMRQYLVHVRDSALVEEYGLWLAGRNPDLAIELFSDDASRVKFSPHQVVAKLKQHAPLAVEKYLEHLVFGKNLDQYADDLIGYYLDSVLNVLEQSQEARELLAQSYATYRIMEAPKPTYLNFIRDNAPSDAWWQSRLRLLQLLGSGSYVRSSSSSSELAYSIPMVLERLAPYSSYLVSESIILDARQGRHKEALRLLTHGLGDFDTAVRYCYFGGPTSSYTIDASLLPSREAQSDLFTHLFHEFLLIENAEERIERTAMLIGKFAAYFDPAAVLAQIPESWSLNLLSEFLLRVLRAIMSERKAAAIVKSLSAAQNLQRQAEWVRVCEKFGARLEGLDFDSSIGGDIDFLTGVEQVRG